MNKNCQGGIIYAKRTEKCRWEVMKKFVLYVFHPACFFMNF